MSRSSTPWQAVRGNVAARAQAVRRTSPPGRTAAWFAAIDERCARAAPAAPTGLGPLDLGARLSEYRDVFRLPGPKLLVGAFVALLALAGHVRGA